MAPSHSRQLLVWTLPTIAILLSYFWFKKKRIGVRSDPGDTRVQCQSTSERSLKEEIEECEKLAKISSPPRDFPRSLSRNDSSAPIDIILPRELRLVKSNPVVISDEELDLEIKKIQSMKSTAEPFNNNNNNNTTPKSDGVETKTPPPTPVEKSKTPSPVVNKLMIKADDKITTTPKKKGKKAKKEAKMAQKDLVSVQKKFSSLKLDTKDTPKKNRSKENNVHHNNEHEELHRQSSERDSANHSPADVMLASPSLSSISDNHSEGSNDSGKGGSDVATPPSRTPAGDGSISGDISVPFVYEFVIPQTLVGRLIGRHGSFVLEIKDKTHAHILIKKHPGSNKLKICAVEGTQMEIDNALQMIRDKFPQKRYPEVTLEQVSFLPPIAAVPLLPENLYLKLIEGINNDTIVSCMVAPNHLFLQQPTHPTFPNLNVLSDFMNMCYSESDSPLLPKPIAENTICVAHSVGAWYRAIILSTDSETDTSYVKFLDYGGYAYVENSKLRQIRGDFLLLPFQAAECVLANIRPVGGEEAVWAEEAYNLVAELTKGAIIYTQIAEYMEDIPLVLCYVVVGPQQVVFLNEELVNRGFAEWVQYQQDETEGAVGGAPA